MSSQKSFRLTRGIPRVTLLGEKRDWKMILERLFRHDIERIAWKHFLHPFISRFAENLNFWSEAAHHGGEGSEPTYLSG
ncbi:hypothetical protein BDR05DRAFT_963834 [Suillus weaverae]|nr:hypothetical protein BDR05DRAFT_963834 [Suillus weaverae]